MRQPSPTSFIRPCAPTEIGRPPRDPCWMHEIKQDGYRIIAHKDGDMIRLWTRLKNECSGRFIQIADTLRRLPISSCTIDGEAVVVRPDGHCDFYALKAAAGSANAVLVAFDLLEFNGNDLRREPIERRRSCLRSLCGAPAMIYSHSFDDDGLEVFEKACALGLEGIVSKRRGSSYQSGRSMDWVKTLNPHYTRRR